MNGDTQPENDALEKEKKKGTPIDTQIFAQ